MPEYQVAGNSVSVEAISGDGTLLSTPVVFAASFPGNYNYWIRGYGTSAAEAIVDLLRVTQHRKVP